MGAREQFEGALKERIFHCRRADPRECHDGSNRCTSSDRQRTDQGERENGENEDDLADALESRHGLRSNYTQTMPRRVRLPVCGHGYVPAMLIPMDSDSTVVLTGVGGAGQVGETVAAAFGKLGASLVLVDRTAEKVEARATELTKAGYRARAYPCDLTNAADVASLVDRVRRDRGESVHALVHMAGGFAMSGPVADATLDVWNRQIAINLTTAFLTTRAFIPMLRRARGSIVLFAAQPAAAWNSRTEHVGIRRREERRRCADARPSPPKNVTMVFARMRSRRSPFAPRRTLPTWATTRSTSSGNRSPTS